MPALKFPEIKLLTPLPEAEQKMISFIAEANEGIKQLNFLIQSYNSEVSIVIKKNLLQQIYSKHKQLDYKFSTFQIQENSEYQQRIHNELFLNIQAQCKELQITSVSQLFTSPADPTSLQEILVNMEPDKVNRLMKTLTVGTHVFSNSSLEHLYQPEEKDYVKFQSFLQRHTIRFLGGGNSKNYLISNNKTLEKSVLKLDNRMGNPREIEVHLREKMEGEGLTPLRIERQGSNQLASDVITYGIIVTDYCSGGDLASYAKRNLTDIKRIDNALQIFSQMGALLTKMQAHGGGFVDMKNANWLLDNKEKLWIADTKSFLFANKNGEIDLDQNSAQGYNRILTPSHIAPELYSANLVSADNMHAYMLGKNLYQFLTNCKNDYLERRVNGENFDFTASVFQTPKGKALKELIIELTQPDPALRLSIKEVEPLLKKLSLANDGEVNVLIKAKEECLAFIGKASPSKSYENSIDKLIQQRKRELFLADNIEEVQKVKILLEKDLNRIKEDCINLIKNTAIYKFEGNEEKINIFLETQLLKINKLPLHGLSIEYENWQSFECSEITKACMKMLEAIAQYKFGEHDTLMKEFIGQKKEKISKAITTKEIEKIYHNLKNIEKNQQQPVVQEIRDIIGTLRKKAQFYTTGYNDKAKRIENAMAQVPVVERHVINEAINNSNAKNSPAWKVCLQLASQRTGIIKGSVPTSNTGEIKEAKRSAKLFKQFKNKLADVKPDKEEIEAKVKGP